MLRAGGLGRARRAGARRWRSLRPATARCGPCTFLRSPLDPREASGLGFGLGALVGAGGSPRVLALPLPVLLKGHEEATARVGRSGKAQTASTRTGLGFRAARAASPAPRHFLRDRALPEGPRQGAPGPPSTRPGPTSGSRRLPLTPVGLSRDCHSSAAKTWGARDRGGGAAYLGQVRSSDSPSGRNRCSPAQHPGPRTDPSVPLCAQGWRSRMSGTQLSGVGSPAAKPGGRGQTRPTSPANP